MTINNKGFNFFSAANSHCGFINYFQQFFKYDKDANCYIIKAGAGCGKSTMMRKIAKFLQENGYNVFLFPCTSDPNSLDGVYCKELNFMIVDGTAPHIIEPNYPIFFEKIVTLYDCIDSEKIQKNGDGLLNYFDENQSYHNRTKNLFTSIKALQDDCQKLVDPCIDKDKLDIYSKKLCKKTLRKSLNKKSKVTNLLLSGITLNGLDYFSETPRKMVKNIYAIHDVYGNCANSILHELYDTCLQKGYDIISCNCPIDPHNKIDHIIIPEADIAFITVNRYLPLKEAADKNIHFARFLKTKVDKIHRHRIRFNNKTISNLIVELQQQLSSAKQSHDDIEKAYVEAINFKTVDIKTNEIINDLKKLIKK